nr:Gag-Pol polyprotein [Tanacetum cinerariifolium]
MDITIDQQVALDEVLIPHASRLRIGKSNFHLRSDITSKESTLQLVYCVLRLTLFYKAFLVTADVPEIYMQEFWATAIVHHHSICFKMKNKKRIVNLEYFQGDAAYIGEIRKLTYVNINKLHQPWRSFTAVINKCLSGKSTGYDSLRLSQAQILWGMYHKKNVDFAYFLWEDFIYQVEHKDAKKSNEMYYPRFTKVIIYFFMTKDPSIPRRNNVNWHYVRDDEMFTKIKLVSRHQNIQQFGAMLPVELTNEDIRKSAAYKEYYAIASGAAPPKTKASVRKTQSSFDITMPPPTAVSTRLSTSAKGKQPAKSSKAKGLSMLSEVAMIKAEQMKLATKRSLQQTHISQASGFGADEGTDIITGVLDVPTNESVEEISWKASDEDEVDDMSDDQEDDDDQEAKDEESFDPIVQTLENSVDKGNDDTNLGMNVGDEEGQDAEDDDEELYRDVNINLEGRDVQMIDVHTTQEFEDTHVTITLVNPDGQQQSSSVSSQFVTSMLNPSPDAGIDSLFESTPWVDVQASTTVSSLTMTAPTLPPPTIPTISQFAGAVSSIPGIVVRYMDQRMNEAIKIIKKHFKEQVKKQVFKILPKIEKTVNDQLKAEVLTRSSNSSKTSYAVVADLSEMKLKKILIEKMESNKSIHQSDEQRNLYKALVDAYKCDKIILDTYGDIVTLKRRRDDANKDEEPFARSDRGSKRRREGKEPESISAPKEKKQKKPPNLDRAWNKTLPATHRSIQPWISDLAKQADSRSSFNELMDTPVDFLAFLMNRLKVDILTPELLAGLTYELMKVNRESTRDVYSKLESSLSPNFRLSNGIITSIWIGSWKDDKSHGQRTLCFQGLSKNVHKKHHHPTVCGRSSTSDGTLNDVRTALDDRLKAKDEEDHAKSREVRWTLKDRGEAWAEGNMIGNICIQIRCYNCRGLGHLARNCTVRPGRRVAAYLQTQLLIAQKEEAGIQLQAEEFDLANLDEIEEVNANCILIANLQQASTSGTQTDKAPVYDSDGSAENFKSLAKEAKESHAKHKDLELEIERLLRAVVSHDILSIVQSNYVMDTSNLQTKIDRTKERFQNCIIKKENEYAKL